MPFYTKKFIRAYEIKSFDQLIKKIEQLENSKTYQPFVWGNLGKEGFINQAKQFLMNRGKIYISLNKEVADRRGASYYYIGIAGDKPRT